MNIILLSGGSGTRLWPLSNDARSKQFLKLLPTNEQDVKESMIQRVVRQLKEAGIDAPLTVATGAGQHDSVTAQLGEEADVVVEPMRRDTFPAICLACEYLSKVKGCQDDEVVVVMPCDPFTEDGYFKAIKRMGTGVTDNAADLIVMGITPTYPSAKYGYILPSHDMTTGGIVRIERFVEKPSVADAEKLIDAGALWNGGVFAFRLGFVREIGRKYVDAATYEETVRKFDQYPKISFDYEVAEKAKSVGMVRFTGTWKDLGTWNTLTDELETKEYGNVVTDGTSENTHVFNELGLPLLCLGTKDLVIAASPDGILVSEKRKSENIKQLAEKLKRRPMYEERRWGTYVVIDFVEFDDGFSALTKRLTLNPGCAISYQRHTHRDEIWTFIDGDGEIVIDGERRAIGRGDTVVIKKGQMHTLRANSLLTFIEVQTGHQLVEEDIERFPFDWK